MRWLQSIRARRVLSFGDPGLDLELSDLNVLIGANGSGKSNLVSLLSLLAAAPSDLSRPISVGGGVREWLWKGVDPSQSAMIEVSVDGGQPAPWTYSLEFQEEAQRFRLLDECLEGDAAPFYRSNAGAPLVNMVTSDPLAAAPLRVTRKPELNPNQSALAQLKGEPYPEITRLAKDLERIAIYADWDFSRHAPARLPQSTDLPADALLENASNLALVIDDLKFHGQANHLRRYLQLASPAFGAVVTRTLGGTIQLFVEEENLAAPTPATRLSQGTLQLLCLLAVLLHPNPPKLVCLEEPEKGFHPDLLPELAKLLVEASQRMQLIVTTHSEVLVDALTDRPESIIVCEKEQGATMMRRLSRDELKEWLEDYSLGQLWRKGTLGGNRW